jgi:primary-amine oxidase
MDAHACKLVRIDKLATGGTEDGLAYDTHSKNVIDHCAPSEYVPELLAIEARKDLKPLNVVQPEGPSFKVTDESLIEWQKWRFRLGFNPREGAVLHDVHYDGRSIMYRLSFSEMTVPYGDPRPPFHRKQAFDFGDGGAGRAANNLGLGCDCLGVIKYFDAVIADSEGKPSVSKNVICLHEQDGGINWKHTNFRTGRAVVARSRELVVQFVITLANYEYVFAYKFDQAAGITVETRATGVVSVVNIDPGKTSPWGNVVSPGVLAQNHQHIFALRMDPAIEGHRNTIFKEESLPLPMSPATNPWGNGYRVVSTPIKQSTHLDASPFTNLAIKLSNPHKVNPISKKPISYKFTPTPSQLLLADPSSIQAHRAAFATHHLWVTSYRDGELWAGGEFTNQSKSERGGVADAVARGDNVEDTDVVVWSVFGLTHNPRVEDWPVMPMEKHELHIRPADFFTANPAMDVPTGRNMSSVQVNGEKLNGECCAGEREGEVQEQAETHFQASRDVFVNGDTNGHPHGNGVNGTSNGVENGN